MCQPARGLRLYPPVGLERRRNLRHRNRAERDHLAAGNNRRQQRIGIGGQQNQDHKIGRFFQGLEQRVGRRRGGLVKAVQDGDPVGGHVGGQREMALEFPDLLHLQPPCFRLGLHPEQVGVVAGGDQVAGPTLPAGARVSLAEKGRGQRPRQRPLADARRAGKQVGMGKFPLLQRLPEQMNGPLVPDDSPVFLHDGFPTARCRHAS